jgi:hypothetical protein
MGYIKEPDGVNFIVDSTPLTEAGKKKISEVIAYYKETGRKLNVKSLSTSKVLIKNNKKVDLITE